MTAQDHGGASAKAALPRRVLIANRGEIAIRIARTAQDLGIAAMMAHAIDDADARHVQAGSGAIALAGRGVAAYLDGAALIQAARAADCDAVHPGYGFLSENADFARACQAAGLIFVGPAPETIALLGDKTRARDLARHLGVPVLAGTDGPTDPAAARAFRATLPPGSALMIKAVAGGGGRGMRAVGPDDDLDQAFARCESEARAAFGDGALYVERLLPRARHVEVQIAGDGVAVSHVWERDCTLQRRHQKIVEIAPAPGLDGDTRAAILEAAVTIGRAAGYSNLGTIEFLIDPDTGAHHFLEANPRLQVEHTVTEAICGLDLVAAQFHLAAGLTLADIGLDQDHVPAPRGVAIQTRVTTETLEPDGTVKLSGGAITLFEPPGGPGVRVDSSGFSGYRLNPDYDPLIAKVIVHAPFGGFAEALRKTERALREFRIDGVATNIPLLRTLLAHPAVAQYRIHTAFIAEQAAGLSEGASALTPAPRRDENAPSRRATMDAPPGTMAVPAPMAGRVVAIEAAPGALVRRAAALAVIEAMKMEHVILAPQAGVVRAIPVALGDILDDAQPVAFLAPAADAMDAADDAATVDLDHVRPDLADYLSRRALTLDAARPEAVAKRHAKGLRTARENLDDLFDPGTFIEYGAFAVAAQRRRRAMSDLIANTPADGLIGGFGSVNGALFDEARARCLGVAYDFTVLAGTQGFQNHRKKDRLFDLAQEWRVPVVLFAEGGGGRPGDVDSPGVAGLDVPTFAAWAKLSGLMPRVAIGAGRCFAGNAALLGCADVVIATRESNIGMGGPAMIEGGGLGVFRPEEIGPAEDLVPCGVIDVLVDDEAAAVAAAKTYLGYFQGPVANWSCADQRLLRHAIPENRLRAYDIRAVIALLADDGSVLELRRGFGHGMITALVRVEGRPFGLIANNPLHLGGAIDAEAADKAARFMQLCDAFDVPLISLCDTPGFMVGPEVERTGQVRRVSRMFVAGANLSVPTFTIVLRKGYGLGAQAMAAGSFHAPVFIIAWPTGEFGGMGLEGAVRLGYRKELEAIADPAERQALYDQLVQRLYQGGKALSMASHFEIDAVIDPIETRRWIVRALASLAPPRPREGKKRAFIDTW